MSHIISGKLLAAQHKQRVADEVRALAQQGIVPCLAVILVGENPASQAYVRGKEKDCVECGIQSRVLRLPEGTSEQELVAAVEALNRDCAVHGILVQLPLPAQIRPERVIEAIAPEKDVDGFTPVNMGRLAAGDAERCYVPCTPAGCMEMLRATGLPLAGRRAVVVGRSNIVGKPMMLLLTAADCTVTLCHSRTRDLASVCREAEILVAAVGRPGFITADMVRPGAIVIDVGINRGADGKLRGDVDFDEVCGKAGAITPVPGGVGLMTRAMLMENTLKAAKNAARGLA